MIRDVADDFFVVGEDGGLAPMTVSKCDDAGGDEAAPLAPLGSCNGSRLGEPLMLPRD